RSSCRLKADYAQQGEQQFSFVSVGNNQLRRRRRKSCTVGSLRGKKTDCHRFPERCGVIELERIFKLAQRSLVPPKLCVSVLVFHNCEHPCRKMVENVTVICPDTGVFGIKSDFDRGFRWNQNGIALCPGDFASVCFGNFKDMPM